MAKCIDCGKEGNWETICPDCFGKALLDADSDDKCEICGMPYRKKVVGSIGLPPCINGHTFNDELNFILKNCD